MPNTKLVVPLLGSILAAGTLGCATANKNSVADARLQRDVLTHIQSQFGQAGPPPILASCKLVDQRGDGSFVESWNVKLFGARGTQDFLVTMKPDANGETDYTVALAHHQQN
ncbi:hypothetical protein GC176_22820 [bacterium]|nr:hypothetical protein [bacterium]